MEVKKIRQGNKMVLTSSHSGIILAIIVKAQYSADGIQFFTPTSFSQQLGYMKRPSGHVIAPHDHNRVLRTIEWTQEVLFIKSGRVRLDLYTPLSREYVESYVLCSGDVVLLANGGHGLLVLEAAEILEVKQGPYAPVEDKTHFLPVDEKNVHFIDAAMPRK